MGNNVSLRRKNNLPDHHGLITAMEHAGLIKIDTIYDSTTNKTELNIKSTYDPLSEDE